MTQLTSRRLHAPAPAQRSDAPAPGGGIPAQKQEALPAALVVPPDAPQWLRRAATDAWTLYRALAHSGEMELSEVNRLPGLGEARRKTAVRFLRESGAVHERRSTRRNETGRHFSVIVLRAAGPEGAGEAPSA